MIILASIFSFACMLYSGIPKLWAGEVLHVACSYNRIYFIIIFFHKTIFQGKSLWSEQLRLGRPHGIFLMF